MIMTYKHYYKWHARIAHMSSHYGQDPTNDIYKSFRAQKSLMILLDKLNIVKVMGG
jgi:hypothetical protein